VGNKLVAADYTPYTLYTENDTYKFGRIFVGSKNHQIIQRIDKSGNITDGANISTLTDQNGGNSTIENILAYDDVVFVQVTYFTGLKRYLFKSVDNGLNFGDNPPNYDNGNWVQEVGSIEGTHYGDISILGSRGFCKTASGQYLYGEYNVAAKTVGNAVSAGTHVRVMASDDNGDTWSSVYTLNTTGNNLVNHCHTVRQDPDSGYIYFGYGDSTGSGIVRWDGSSTGGDNIAPANVGSVSGFVGVGGEVKYQTTDLLFTTDWIYNPVDTAVDGSQGIYRLKRDLSGYEKIYTGNASFTGHSLYWGLKHSSGTLIATEILEAAATDWTLYFHTSDDDGVSWTNVARVGLRADSGSATGLFEGTDGLIYYSAGLSFCGKANGTDRNGTVIIDISGTFNQAEKEILHPAYWVSPNGSDSNDGYSTGAPFATLKYALTGDRVTFVSKVNLTEGRHESDSIDADWQANAYPGLDDGALVISGVDGQTSLIYDTDNAGQGITLEASDGDVTIGHIRTIRDDPIPLVLESGYDGTFLDNSTRGRVNWR